MKQTSIFNRRVAGIFAPAPRPTLLGAAVIAASVAIVVGMTALVLDLALLGG